MSTHVKKNTVFCGTKKKKIPEIEASLHLQVPERPEMKLGELEQQLLK